MGPAICIGLSAYIYTTFIHVLTDFYYLNHPINNYVLLLIPAWPVDLYSFNLQSVDPSPLQLRYCVFFCLSGVAFLLFLCSFCCVLLYLLFYVDYWLPALKWFNLVEEFLSWVFVFQSCLSSLLQYPFCNNYLTVVVAFIT
jgi:hypothetical protein